MQNDQSIMQIALDIEKRIGIIRPISWELIVLILRNQSKQGDDLCRERIGLLLNDLRDVIKLLETDFDSYFPELLKRDGSVLNQERTALRDYVHRLINDFTVLSREEDNTETARDKIDELMGRFADEMHTYTYGFLDRLKQSAVQESEIEDSVQTEDLSAAAKEIDKVYRRITMISLNASIESARIGEKGKGFEVLAQEIRSLADTSKYAFEKIKSKLLTA